MTPLFTIYFFHAATPIFFLYFAAAFACFLRFSLIFRCLLTFAFFRCFQMAIFAAADADAAFIMPLFHASIAAYAADAFFASFHYADVANLRASRAFAFRC